MSIFTVTTAEPVVTTNGGEGYRLIVPLTVAAVPGATGTMLVEFQVVSGGEWYEWPDSVVSAKTVGKLNSAVYALRFTADTADGTVEVRW
jgi:hypothetical protein